MKKLKLLLTPLVAVSLLASCGTTKEYVTITFDAGIGAFEDSNIIKTLTVKNGTKLSDCEIDKPIFAFDDGSISPVIDIKKEVDYWSNDNGERIAENYVVTNDTNLTANYYPLLDIKNLCTGVALNALIRAYSQASTQKFEEFIQNYIKTSMDYESPSQPIGCFYIANNVAFVYSVKTKDPVLTYSNAIIDYLDGILDCRAQVVGKLGGDLIKIHGQYDSEKFTDFCYNCLFDFVKKVKYEYIPWANILCSSALHNIFEAILHSFDDEIREALFEDTPFFTNSIDVSKNSNTAHQISLIGAKFFEDIAQAEEVDVEIVNTKFEEAKAKVEELL